MIKRSFLLVFAAALSITPGLAASPEPNPAEPKTVVFDIYFDNTSMEPTSAAERERIKKVSNELRAALTQSGQYDVFSGADESFSSIRGTSKCSQEERALARQQHAKFVGCPWLQKVSNLILNLNLVIEDVETGALIKGGSVDIRGNTDQSWDRALKYLMTEHIL